MEGQMMDPRKMKMGKMKKAFHQGYVAGMRAAAGDINMQAQDRYGVKMQPGMWQQGMGSMGNMTGMMGDSWGAWGGKGGGGAWVPAYAGAVSPVPIGTVGVTTGPVGPAEFPESEAFEWFPGENLQGGRFGPGIHGLMERSGMDEPFMSPGRLHFAQPPMHIPGGPESYAALSSMYWQQQPTSRTNGPTSYADFANGYYPGM